MMCHQAFLVFLTIVGVQSYFEPPELMSELPIEKLLLKKKTALMELNSKNDRVGPQSAALVRPLAHMQYRGVPVDRGHYEEEEEEEEEEWQWMSMPKGKGIGQIFDGSVTALAFLAFGGYLLCLVVHAIKDKKEDNMMEPTQQTLQFVARPGAAPVRLPVLTVRPGRRRRATNVSLSNDILLNKLIESGYLFAQQLVKTD